MVTSSPICCIARSTNNAIPTHGQNLARTCNFLQFGHMAEFTSIVATWLADAPKDMLSIFDDVLEEVC
jgi:hypothetical protein